MVKGNGLEILISLDCSVCFYCHTWLSHLFEQIISRLCCLVIITEELNTSLLTSTFHNYVNKLLVVRRRLWCHHDGISTRDPKMPGTQTPLTVTPPLHWVGKCALHRRSTAGIRPHPGRVPAHIIPIPKLASVSGKKAYAIFLLSSPHL